MQIYIQGPLAKTLRTHIGYISHKIAKNNIGSVGVQHLSKGVWKNLNLLVLSKSESKADDNLIEGEGVAHLLKADWKQIGLLNLGIDVAS